MGCWRCTATRKEMIGGALATPGVPAHASTHRLQQSSSIAWWRGGPAWCPACDIPCCIVVMLAVMAGCHAANDAIRMTAVGALKKRDLRPNMSTKLQGATEFVKLAQTGGAHRLGMSESG